MLILQLLCIPITAYISWEIDKSCQDLLRAHFPQVHQRGDFTQDDTGELLELLDRYDPEGLAEIIFTAGPPCPDYSSIRGKRAPGRKGTTGRLFDDCVNFLEKVRAQSGRRICFLFENVVMEEAEYRHFNGRLGCTAVVGDAADLGLYGSPAFQT